jgi:hypothetical protein
MSLSRGWRGIAKPTQERRVKFTIPMASPPSENLMRKYAMLDYIIAFWTFHTADLTLQSVCWPSFRYIACERELMFDFRPWDDPEHHIRLQQAGRRGTYAHNENVMKTMLLYSYAMRHGIRSLLLLRRQNSTCDAVFAAMPNLKLTEHLMHLLRSLSTKGPSQPSRCGFWSGDLLVHLIQEVDSPPSGFLNFLWEQYSKWKDSADVRSWNGMFNDTISISSRLDDITVFKRLLGHCQHCEPSKYVAILIAVIRKGQVRKQVMRDLLYHPFVGDCSIGDLWELMFAFHECFPTVESILNDMVRSQIVGASVIRSSAFGPTGRQVNITIGRALLAIILAWGKQPSLLKPFFGTSGAFPEPKHPFDMQ